MQSLTFVRTALLGACVVSGVQVSADELNGSILEPKEKSTLETILLPTLEQDDLAGAVIAGTLDAPAAGDEEEKPLAVQLMPKELQPAEDLSDMGRYNVPARIDIRPQPLSIEGRTYSWDYR